MNNNHRLAGAFLFGILLGAAASGIYGKYDYKKKLDRWVQFYGSSQDALTFANHTLRISENLDTLTGLRQSQIDYLISMHEFDLGSEIDLLYSAFPSKTVSDTNSVFLLKKVAQYAVAHPIKTGNEQVDSNIVMVLNKARNK